MEKLYDVIGETLVVYLPEELDHHTAGEIKRGTEELFTGKKIRDVVFDYRRTVFMDSSGIGLIMARYREVHYLKGDVFIVGVQEKMKRILEISGLYRVAKQRKDIQEALGCIREKYEAV